MPASPNSKAARGVRPKEPYRLTSRLEGLRVEADQLAEQIAQLVAVAEADLHNIFQLQVSLAHIGRDAERIRRLMLQMAQGAPPPEDQT